MTWRIISNIRKGIWLRKVHNRDICIQAVISFHSQSTLWWRHLRIRYLKTIDTAVGGAIRLLDTAITDLAALVLHHRAGLITAILNRILEASDRGSTAVRGGKVVQHRYYVFAMIRVNGEGRI